VSAAAVCKADGLLPLRSSGSPLPKAKERREPTVLFGNAPLVKPAAAQ